MKVYPSMRYHPEKDPVQVQSAEHDQALGEGWYQSPAEFGVETCPGVKPDPVIAAIRAERERAKTAEVSAPAEKRKPGRPAKGEKA